MDPNRRSFFKSFFHEMLVLSQETRGIKHIALNQLHLLPENVFPDLIPIYFPERGWQFKETSIEKWNLETETWQKFKSITSVEYFISRQFEKQKNLTEVAEFVAQEFNLNQSDAFETVKAFFLELAKLRICHPLEEYHIETG